MRALKSGGKWRLRESVGSCEEHVAANRSTGKRRIFWPSCRDKSKYGRSEGQKRTEVSRCSGCKREGHVKSECRVRCYACK